MSRQVENLPDEDSSDETCAKVARCDLPLPSSSEPFLRWAGGKRWLADCLSTVFKRRLSSKNGKYFEPFLGSGAIYFAVCPQQSVLNDLNRDLMIAYAAIRDQPYELVQKIKSWSVDKDTYYEIRGWEPTCDFERACRFIWLNRTCYGGLHRTNRNGKFNTPYGGGSRTPDCLWTKGIALSCASTLRQGCELYNGDFEAVVTMAKAGDLVFCDPTYSNHEKDHFDRYGANVFTWNDQVRLAQSCRQAMTRGATVVVTNGAYEEIAEIYPDAYRIKRRRSLTLGKRHAKGTDQEYIFILDPLRRRKDWSEIGQIENRIRQPRTEVPYEHGGLSFIKSHLPPFRALKVAPENNQKSVSSSP